MPKKYRETKNWRKWVVYAAAGLVTAMLFLIPTNTAFDSLEYRSARPLAPIGNDLISSGGLYVRYEQSSSLPSIVLLDKSCSGFVVAKDLVLTARHCVENSIGKGRTIQVEFESGQSAPFLIRAFGAAIDDKDFAVLEGPTGDIQPLTLSDGTYAGDITCATAGHSINRNGQQMTFCELIGRREEGGYIKFAGTVFPGNSGSPLFHGTSGEVIGIAVRTGYPIPVGLAVPIENVRAALEKVIEDNAIHRPSK